MSGNSDYYTGITMPEIPTGFAGSTGVLVKNASAYIVDYAVRLESDSGYENSFYLSKDNNIYDINSFGRETRTSLSLDSVKPGFSKSFYVLHKPLLDASTGDETCSIYIDTVSSLGDSDETIQIDVTGKRITDPPAPDNVGSFYCVKTKNGSSLNMEFHWNFVTNNNYVTGFRLDFANNDSFSPTDEYFIAVDENSNPESLPTYGGYNGLEFIRYSYQFSDLSLNSNYYARIVPINTDGETGNAAYATGFENLRPFKLDAVTYSGLHPSPGENLRFTAAILNLEYSVNQIDNFDLLDFILDNNRDSQGNISYDFSAYSGINIQFKPESSDYIEFRSYNPTQVNVPLEERGGAINLVKANIPSDKNLIFSTNNDGEFTIILNFEKTKLLGDPDYYNEDDNSGAIFYLDDLSYTDTDNNRIKCVYEIRKDPQSAFYAGWNNGAAYIENDADNSNNSFVYVANASNRSLNLLTKVGQDSVLSSDRSVGKLLSSNGDKYPEAYLEIIEKQNFSYANYDLFFRFTTDDITASVGSQVNAWSNTGDDVYSFDLSGPFNCLSVVEAYGHKFYELGSEQTISTVQNFIVSNRPSYGVLVFALARNSKPASVYDLRNDCKEIHKFIANRDSSPRLRNFQDNLALFNAGLMNTSYYGRKFGYYGADNYGANFQTLFNSRVNPSINGELFQDDYTHITAGNVYSYTVPNKSIPLNLQNISELGSISTPFGDSNGVFSIETSGGSENLERFELYFVEMLFGPELGKGQVQGFTTNLSKIEPIRNINYFRNRINGAESYIGMYDCGPPLPPLGTAANNPELHYMGGNYLLVSDNYKISLSNSSPSGTRLFLFDYLFGLADTNEERDRVSKKIVSHLTNKLGPILLKSANRFQIAGNIFNQNTAVNFPVGAHPLINIWGQGNPTP
jgi:hypothetical protein